MPDNRTDFRARVGKLFLHHNPDRKTPHGSLIWVARRWGYAPDTYTTPYRWGQNPPERVWRLLERDEKEAGLSR